MRTSLLKTLIEVGNLAYQRPGLEPGPDPVTLVPWGVNAVCGIRTLVHGSTRHINLGLDFDPAIRQLCIDVRRDPCPPINRCR